MNNTYPVYFVHSFRALPNFTDDVIAVTDYDGCEIVSLVQKDNLFGCQFHPEKSGPVGLLMLENFLLV